MRPSQRSTELPAYDDVSYPRTGYSSGYRDALNGYPTRRHGGRYRGYDPDAQTRIDWE